MVFKYLKHQIPIISIVTKNCSSCLVKNSTYHFKILECPVVKIVVTVFLALVSISFLHGQAFLALILKDTFAGRQYELRGAIAFLEIEGRDHPWQTHGCWVSLVIMHFSCAVLIFLYDVRLYADISVWKTDSCEETCLGLNFALRSWRKFLRCCCFCLFGEQKDLSQNPPRGSLGT